MYCSNCGKEIPDDSKFCPKCGSSVEPAERQSAPDQKTLEATVAAPTYPADMAEAASDAQSAVGLRESRIPLYLWPLVMVLLQAAGITVGIMMSMNPMTSFFSPGYWIAAALMGLGIVIVPVIDIIYLSSIGIRGAWKWSVLILPLYLFIRASKTNRRYVLPIIYLILIAAGVVWEFVGPDIILRNLVNEVESADGDTTEALQDGEPVTYAELMSVADLDALEMPWEGDIAVAGIVTDVTTQELLDTPVQTYIVAADGDPDQLIEVLCTEADPVPVPKEGDAVAADGMYVGIVNKYPRILGTVFRLENAEDAMGMGIEATSTPAAAATTSAPATPKQPVLTFTLSREQAVNLAEEVAAPLLLTEWYATITGADYDESIWHPEYTRRAEDYTGRTVAGDVDFGATLWAEYMWALRDMLLDRQRNPSPTDSVFDTGVYMTDTQSEPRLVIESPTLNAYFQEAFGNGALADVAVSIPENIVTPSGDVQIALSDGAYGLTMNLPSTFVRVQNGKVSFTGYIVSDAEWVAAPLEITLDVEQAQNHYGCRVTGYSVGAAPASILPEELIAAMLPETVAPQANGATFDANGFVFADSSERYLTMDDIANLNKDMLGYARNEIFARNGNLFRTDKYIEHYNSYDWYRNMPGKRYGVEPYELNPIEQANVNLIREREEQLG